MSRSAPQSGPDTELARLLHRTRRLEPVVLRELLSAARARRPDGVTLADLLVQHGLIEASELAPLLPRIQRTLSSPERFWASFGEEHPTLPLSAQHGEVRIGPATVSAMGAEGEVGPYRIVGPIGQGGMGLVFQALDPQGGSVALKCAKPGEHGGHTERLRREGLAQARVPQHPNVVQVLEQGEHKETPYLAMELVSGGTLGARLRQRRRLGEAEAREIGVGLARGLSHMHAHGVLHRDVKPANVLFDERGVPKLVDFGLARFPGMITVTETGEVLGTPLYMAPEQALGYKSQIGPATDVYALGIVLYELLTGETPFPAPTGAHTLTRLVTESPAPPSSLRPDLDPDLETLILAMLAKTPNDRPSLEQVIEALQGADLATSGIQLALQPAPAVPKAVRILLAVGLVTLLLSLLLLVWIS